MYLFRMIGVAVVVLYFGGMASAVDLGGLGDKMADAGRARNRRVDFTVTKM